MTKANKYLSWTPRVLGILFACFLAIFSFDVITPEASVGEIAIGLFLHNLPVFVLAGLLAVAWRRPLVGAIGFSVAGALFVLLAVAFRVPEEGVVNIGPLILAAPALLVGVLFYLDWRAR